jgi:hypothetical protein
MDAVSSGPRTRDLGVGPFGVQVSLAALTLGRIAVGQLPKVERHPGTMSVASRPTRRAHSALGSTARAATAGCRSAGYA